MNREALEALREKVEAGEFSRDDALNALGTRELTGYADRAFLGSLDAAKALHEALLPGWAVNSLIIWPGSYSRIEIIGTHEMSGERWHGNGDGAAEGRNMIPARAWLLAILSALLAEGGE